MQNFKRILIRLNPDRVYMQNVTSFTAVCCSKCWLQWWYYIIRNLSRTFYYILTTLHPSFVSFVFYTVASCPNFNKFGLIFNMSVNSDCILQWWSMRKYKRKILHYIGQSRATFGNLPVASNIYRFSTKHVVKTKFLLETLDIKSMLKYTEKN